MGEGGASPKISGKNVFTITIWVLYPKFPCEGLFVFQILGEGRASVHVAVFYNTKLVIHQNVTISWQ